MSENLSIYTPTELLKFVNDSKTSHEKIKKEINVYLDEIDELEIKINNLVNKVNEQIESMKNIELVYLSLIEEINNRENAI